MTDAENKRKFAELSLLVGVPMITNATDNSRLTGLQKKLQQAALFDLALMKKMTTKEIRETDSLIDGWLKDIGWWQNSAHIGALISFCLDMVEGSPFTYRPKILKTLNQIAEHLEKGKELPYPSQEEAAAIANYWRAIYA